MEAACASPQGFARKVAALARPTDIGPKALRAHNTRLVVGALMAIGLALLLYRSQRDAGFAILVALGGAAGWLLPGRVASLICLAEVIALAGWLWSGSLPWTTGLVQIAIVTSVTGLAHLAAESELGARRNAVNERRLDGLTLLLEAAESLARTPDRDLILKTAVSAAARVVSRSGNNRSAHAAFHEVIGERIKITVVADEPPEREIASGFEYPIARNQAARAAIRTGRPAFVRPGHLSSPLRELADRLEWPVLIMAPVYCAGSLHGLLAASARDGPAVDQLQQYLLGALARLTSSSLNSGADKQELLSAVSRLRARRPLLGRHCVAVLRLASPESANSTELIRLVADRLRSRLRREDLIFRNAEDELVCSFADMDKTDAWPILDRIKTELASELGYTPFGIGLTSLSPDQPADSFSRVEAPPSAQLG